MTETQLNSNQPMPNRLAAAIDEISGFDAPTEYVDRVAKQAMQLDPPTKQQLPEAKTKRRTKFWQWAVTAAVAGGIVLGVSIFSSRSGNVFAQMQAALSELKTISFVSVVVDAKTGEESPVLRSYYRPPHHIRQELSDEIAMIFDLEKQMGMTIDSQHETADIFPLYGQQENYVAMTGAIRFLRQPSTNGKRIGERELEGRTVLDYEVEFGEETLSVVIDQATNLPVSVSSDKNAKVTYRWTIKDFVFDEADNPAKFTLDPPAGYKVTRVKRKSTNASDSKILFDIKAGFSNAKFGVSKEELISKIGQPDDQSGPEDMVQVIPPKVQILTGEALLYPSRGIELVVEKKVGLYSVVFYGGGTLTHRVFEGEFGKGIRMGATREQLIAAFGNSNVKPLITNNEVAGDLIYVAKGIRTAFRFEEKKLNWVQSIKLVE